MSLDARVHALWRAVLISEAVVVALVVFFVLFALAIIAAALWYNLRQEKQVRMDREVGDEEFMLRPGEADGEGDEDEQDGEALEPGTERFRKA